MVQVFAFLLLLTASSYAVPITNFAVVDAAKGIYRGGHPTAEQFRYLQSIGVSNIVKLDTAWEGSDSCAKRLGMTIHAHPISLWRQIFGPVKGVRQAASEITPGTYVHCVHGQDRTGEVIATYRVLACGWSKKDAENEMVARGFHKILFGLWWNWKHFKP